MYPALEVIRVTKQLALHQTFELANKRRRFAEAYEVEQWYASRGRRTYPPTPGEFGLSNPQFEWYLLLERERVRCQSQY